MKRLVLAAFLLVAPAATAAPYALPDEYMFVSGTDAAGHVTTSGATAASTSPATPPVTKRVARYGYFFAAYAVVWGALAAYIAYLASRIAAIEARLPRRN